MREFFKTINWWIVIVIFLICKILDKIHPDLFFIFAGIILILAIYIYFKEVNDGNK